VGSGLLLQEVKEFYHANRLVGTFTGFSNQSELARYYSAADLHVLSSAEETWGLVVNETMNFSLPQIVTTGAACGNDLVEGKGNGFVVPIDNASALAEKLDWFFENRSKCAEMGRKSLEVIRHWGVKEAADGIVIGARRLVLRK
jgi:glycosyltransferase involved in cell wall biosynthesis